MSRNYDFRSESFRPLATAIGELALVWNDLGMVLSRLFWAATRIPNGMAADAIWNPVKSDRMQRDMIVSLVKLNALGFQLNNNLRKEILWCLNEINNLEDLRNNAIHSPVLFDSGTVTAWHHLGNLRAKNLSGKNLLTEFRWFYDSVIVLREYCEKLTDCFHRPDNPIPRRPVLPNRGTSKSSK